jgi:hypothetical protein
MLKDHHTERSRVLRAVMLKLLHIEKSTCLHIEMWTVRRLGSCSDCEAKCACSELWACS